MMYLEYRSCPVAASDDLGDLGAVHTAVRLSRTGCPDHTVKSQGGLEHYCRLGAVPAAVLYAVH